MPDFFFLLFIRSQKNLTRIEISQKNFSKDKLGREISLSENDMVYRGLSHRSWDITNKNIKKDAGSAGI